MRRIRRWGALAVMSLHASLAMSCSGSTDTLSVPPPDAGGDTGPSPLPSATTPIPAENGTITITKTGLSTKGITVRPGASVTFVNNDNAPHEIRSDPDPTDSQCPELNFADALEPTKRLVVTMAEHAETCGFHDQVAPADAAFHGTIEVVDAIAKDAGSDASEDTSDAAPHASPDAGDAQ